MRTPRCPWSTRPSAAARASPWALAPMRREPVPVPVQGLGQGLVTRLQAQARWAAAAAASARIAFV